MSDDSNGRSGSTVLTSAGTVVLAMDPGREGIAGHVNDVLMSVHRKGGRFHAESALTEIGALAGFSAQMGLRKGIIEPQKLDPQQILVGANTRSGEIFYFSDAMNRILFERMEAPPYSIWSYVAGMVADPQTLPDVIAIVRHAARMVGTREFGVPHVAHEHMPQRPTRLGLNENWRVVHEILARAGRPPMEWPFDLARTAQLLMGQSKDAVALPLAAQIVMEAAIPMAKVDPRTVPGA